MPDTDKRKGKGVHKDGKEGAKSSGRDDAAGWEKADEQREARLEAMREKVRKSLGGDGRVALPDAALEALVRSSRQDLIDRGVLVFDPETGEYDLREDVERRQAGRRSDRGKKEEDLS